MKSMWTCGIRRKHDIIQNGIYHVLLEIFTERSSGTLLIVVQFCSLASRSSWSAVLDHLFSFLFFSAAVFGVTPESWLASSQRCSNCEKVSLFRFGQTSGPSSPGWSEQLKAAVSWGSREMTDGLILKMAAEKQTNTVFNYLLCERAWLSQYGACHFTSAARVPVKLTENNQQDQG